MIEKLPGNFLIPTKSIMGDAIKGSKVILKQVLSDLETFL
jgi:hypothetical protein